MRGGLHALFPGGTEVEGVLPQKQITGTVTGHGFHCDGNAAKNVDTGVCVQQALLRLNSRCSPCPGREKAASSTRIFAKKILRPFAGFGRGDNPPFPPGLEDQE